MTTDTYHVCQSGAQTCAHPMTAAAIYLGIWALLALIVIAFAISNARKKGQQ